MHTVEETYRCIQKAQAGDAAAKETLIQEHSGLIWSVVRRFHGRGEPEDLYQLGAIGLLKCIEKFDFQYGVKFSTYAVPMIVGEIKRFLRDDGTVKVSRSLKQLAFRAKRMQETCRQEENRELTVQELARALEVEEEELLLAMEAGREVESLSSPQREEGYTLLEQLSDKTEQERVMERLSLREALEKLPPRERQIILLRYFQDRTQSDVAKRLGISQVQVSRIEKRSLSQLREGME